jgi:tetratricopeptide (TPR) repeat protein
LGLPAILFTYIVQRTAHSALVRTPTLTTGGTTAPHGTMATLALKASPHVSWRRTTRGGVLAFAGFIVIVGVVMVLRAFGIGPAASLLASGRITAKEPVLVTDFAVRGADSTLGGIVVEALRASLGQSNAVTLVSPGAVAAALVRMERPPSSRIDLALARDVAQREGIKAIVDGDVAGLGTGYVVSVRLVTADSGRVLTTVQQAVDGPKELIASLDDMGRTLRGRLGESLRSVQDAPRLEEVTTPSLDALREYSEGVRAYDFDADVPGAVAHLKAAIAFDTNFAMAWRKLGVAYTMGGYSTAAADSAGGRAYELRDRLPPAERLVTEGSYFMDGPARNRLRSIAAWDQLLARGDSLPAANDEAELLAQRRQLPRSDSLFRAAIRLNHAPVAYLGLASDQLGEGRAAQALATLDTLIHTRPAASALDASRMERIVIYMTVGDYARAQAMVDTSLGSSSDLTIAGAHHAAMLLAAIEGRLSRVPVEMLATAVATPAVARPTPLFDSMTVALLDATIREQPARAVQRLDASLAAMPFATRPPAERNYYWAATIYALAGRPDRAKGIMAQRNAGIRDTTRLRNEEPQLHRVLGEIALAEGRPNDAVREFWKGDSVSDGPADGCDACTDFALARAYDKANQPDSAVRYFEKYFASTSDLRPDSVDLFARGPAARRLGELYEAAGNRAAAARYYQMFVDLWKNADADLEPQVAEVRRRLARLGKRTD